VNGDDGIQLIVRILMTASGDLVLWGPGDGLGTPLLYELKHLAAAL